jgi:Zn ribbon nucleic-acid-binding protein
MLPAHVESKGVTMFGSQASVRVVFPIPATPCPKCGADLRLTYLCSDKGKMEQRMLECAECGHQEADTPEG